jgi:hypothetical protein
MNIDNFYRLSPDQQFDIIAEKNPKEPFYIERLRTAIQTNNPLTICFLDNRPIDIYNNLKSYLKWRMKN